MPRILKISTAVVEANFHWTYVRVYSTGDGGLYGTGECFFAPGLTRIIEEFAGVLVGEDFCNIEKLVEKMKDDLGTTGFGPGCRPLGKVENPQPLIGHDGKVRPGFESKSDSPPKEKQQ